MKIRKTNDRLSTGKKYIGRNENADNIKGDRP